MVALRQPKYITPQEYLEWEDKAETKSEYHDGVIVAMAGADPEHNAIVFNCAGELRPQLLDGNCRGFGSDLRVRVPACNKYFYPDVTIGCEETQYESIKGVRSLLNPTLIVEVLSASTEAHDRGDKFACYRSIASLSTYVLVAQNRPMVEVFTRQGNGLWQLEEFSGLESVVPLPAIGISLRLTDIYARVQFPMRLTNRTEEGATETE